MSDAAANLYVDSQEMRWVEGVLCQGKSDLFFAPFAARPEARVRRAARAAQLCAVGPAMESCKQHARDHRELGFWGGEAEAERATAGFAPTTPIIGRRQVAARRAAAALAEVG